MTTQTQLPLFELAPRDHGKAPAGLGEGGLAILSVRNFKGIGTMDLVFEPITLLVGGNNSGMSTILQAIRLFYYCIDKCGVPGGGEEVIVKKHVMPFSDFTLIPAHEIKELVTGGLMPRRKNGIKPMGQLKSGRTFDFTIYAAYSTLMVIDPGTSSPAEISREEFDACRAQPLYVPGFFGVVTRELLATNRLLEELLTSGHHSEVLRNLVLRLNFVPDTFEVLATMLQELFGVKFQGIPGDPNASEYLRAAYTELGTKIPLDVVSAGSGFLQVLQFLAHALRSPSPLLLLDEPDAHMHVQLQERFIDLLRSFAHERKMQVIMASHSETFLRNVDLDEIRLIDRKTGRADTFKDPVTLQAELNTHGIWPDHPELAEALRIKRVVLCESPADAVLLSTFGKKLHPWGLVANMFQVIATEGSSESIVTRVRFAIEVLNKLLNGQVRAAYLRDRDLMCDEWVEQVKREAEDSDLHLFITSRRNRESYLVDPQVIEAAVQAQESLPEDWQGDGAVQALVSKWCLEFCLQEQDELPVKVDEYNARWIRSKFPDNEAQRAAKARLEGFIRESWHEKIQAKTVPWSLMDGRGALRFVREQLAQE